MNWTSPAELKAEVQKWWDRGDLLAEQLGDKPSFPRRLRFKRPSSGEMTGKFEQLRDWISKLKKLDYFRVEMREFKHRVYGKNSVPDEVWVDSLDDAIKIVGKRKEASCFTQIVSVTRAQEPSLLSWLKMNPHVGLKLADNWERILRVVNWLHENPRPNIYLRKAPISGVHTKFIENNRGVLSELLDIVLPPTAIDFSASGVNQFNRRYGFKEKPIHVRFRILDPKSALLPGSTEQDIALDSNSFVRLNHQIKSVFITENEINFLAFPDLPGSMIIFGAGYGFEMIKNASWLMHCDVYYWGDIDTNGFAILNSLRSHLPHTCSLLMDELTLQQHTQFWTTEGVQKDSDKLTYLTNEEQNVYNHLIKQTWGNNIRLEQERVEWEYALNIILDTLALSSSERENCVPSNKRANTKLPKGNIQNSLRLTASDFYTYLRPSQCDLRVYLNHAGAPEASPSPYQEVIQKLGKAHESHHLVSFSNITDLSELVVSERISATLKAIAEKKEVIYHPFFAVSVTLAGHKVEIRGEPDFLLLESDEYVIRDVKIARRITAQDHPEILLQMQLYGWLFAQVTGRTAVRLEVYNGQNCVINIPDDEGRGALCHLFEILKYRTIEREPYSPVGWAKCGDCSFNERCWHIAEENRDVACLVGVDQELAKSLHQMGCPTIDALLSQFDQLRLENVERRIGTKIQRVGKKAVSILRSADAIISNRHLLIEIPELPTRPNYVMFDLEGIPPHFDEAEKVYLWGLQVFGAKPGSFTPAIAGFGSEGDEKGWDNFLDIARRTFNEHGDIPFIHWHHYERVKLDMYMERYGDKEGIAARVRSNLFDLLPVTMQSVALPLPSFSLKVVEKYVGYQRTQQEFGGDWAMSKYIEAVECDNEVLRKQFIDQVLQYNREDLEATWCVFQWLKSLVERAGVL